MLAQAPIARVGAAIVVVNQAQTKFGFAKAAGHEDSVTWPGALPEDRPAAAAFPDDRHINKDLVAAGRVSTGGRTVEAARSGAETAQESSKPVTAGCRGQGQAPEEAARLGSDRGQIARCPRKALPADRTRRMPVEQEVRT